MTSAPSLRSSQGFQRAVPKFPKWTLFWCAVFAACAGLAGGLWLRWYIARQFAEPARTETPVPQTPQEELFLPTPTSVQPPKKANPVDPLAPEAVGVQPDETIPSTSGVDATVPSTDGTYPEAALGVDSTGVGSPPQGGGQPVTPTQDWSEGNPEVEARYAPITPPAEPLAPSEAELYNDTVGRYDQGYDPNSPPVAEEIPGADPALDPASYEVPVSP